METLRTSYEWTEQCSSDCRFIDETHRAYCESIRRRAKAAAGKKVGELSEAEKFAVAILAGVPLNEGFNERGHMTLRPCTIVEDGYGYFVVYTD